MDQLPGLKNAFVALMLLAVCSMGGWCQGARPTVLQVTASTRSATAPVGPIARDFGNGEKLFSSSGSGFLMKFDGKHYLVTCDHVVGFAETPMIEINDEQRRRYLNSKKGGDTFLDVALFEMQPSAIRPEIRVLDIAKENPVVGSQVTGYGFKKDGTLQLIHGKVSGRDVYTTRYVIPHYLLYSTDFDVPIGFSGGPIVDSEGKIVGMMVGGDSIAKVGYFLPAATLRKATWEIAVHESVQRVYVGGIWEADQNGVLLKGLLPGGAGGVLANQVGHRLLRVNDQTVKDLASLRTIIERIPTSMLDFPLRMIFSGDGPPIRVDVGASRMKNDNYGLLADYFFRHTSLLEKVKNLISTLNFINRHGETEKIVAIGIADSELGFLCTDIWDLGTILKTFLPGSKLVIFGNRGGTVAIQLPPYMIY